MTLPRLIGRQLTSREVVERQRRRQDLRDTSDTAIYIVLRYAVIALILSLAAIGVYRAFAHGDWLPVSATIAIQRCAAFADALAKHRLG